MGRKSALSSSEMVKIDVYHSENYSYREIGKKIGRSHNVIMNYIKNKDNYRKNYKGGTYSALTAQDRRKILRIASNSAHSTSKIRNMAGVNASKSTVRRAILKCEHLQLKKLAKKPPLNAARQLQRLQFAKDHMTWDVQRNLSTNDWRNVVFSDEKKFNLDGPDGYNYYFHDIRKEERFLSRHHSREGGVMVWAAISYFGTIDLRILSSRMTGIQYKNILETVFPKINERFGPIKWVYQHDNAPIHTARVAKSWINSQNIQILNWPPYSPDLNIIENVWGWLSRKVYEGGKQYETKDELIEGIYAAWREISLDYLKSLYDSMKDRIYEVIVTKGKFTHY